MATTLSDIIQNKERSTASTTNDKTKPATKSATGLQEEQSTKV